MTTQESQAFKAFKGTLAALSPLVNIPDSDKYLYGPEGGSNPFAGPFNLAEGAYYGYQHTSQKSYVSSLIYLQWLVGGAQTYATQAGRWTDQIAGLFNELVSQAGVVLTAFSLPATQVNPGVPPPAPLPVPPQS